MNSCPKCGANFADSVRICPNDGTVLESGATVDPRVGTLLDGKYKLEAPLGEGGMGTVYRAGHAAANSDCDTAGRTVARDACRRSAGGAARGARKHQPIADAAPGGRPGHGADADRQRASKKRRNPRRC